MEVIGRVESGTKTESNLWKQSRGGNPVRQDTLYSLDPSLGSGFLLRSTDYIRVVVRGDDKREKLLSLELK